METQSIRELWQHMQRSSPHRHKLASAALTCAWKRAMPDRVIAKTEHVFFKKGKLFIRLTSSVLRQSLLLHKAEVLDRVRAFAPAQCAFDIIFL